MVVLTELSLNKRHQEFNRKVAEAAQNNVSFDDIKIEGIESDIDNLFKINLASKFKNIDYIIKVLKSGDSLCITKALKCSWMFDPEYSNIINPNYIHDNIFPHLSPKSIHKLITAVARHVRDEQRALEFFNFCKSLKYDKEGLKFLLFTSEETKLNLLKNNSSVIANVGWSYMRHFIGGSFTLAQAKLESAYLDRQEVLYQLRYLYSLNPTKYLDLLENYNRNNYWPCRKFGLRISKHIITKNKDRVYKIPKFYTKLIKKSIIIKYSTVDDAKYYLAALLPSTADSFWYENYYESQKHFFDMIPTEERFQFLKKIFREKYPSSPFEMTIQFYNYRYYDLIIDLELKEEWALSHIESGKEILGSGKDYLWYRFVKFSKSFDEIKKYVRINKDPDVRAQIVQVLVESARNDRELETLFKYYYERHINEERVRKEQFLKIVDRDHNILNFDADCFTALDKIFYSLEIYNTLTTYNCKSEFKILGLIYRIINNMEIPEALIKFIDESISFYELQNYTEQLAKEKVPLVFNYVIEFYLDKIKSFDDKIYDDSVKTSVRKYVHLVLDLMQQFGKPKEEIPEITIKYANLDWEEFKYHRYFHRYTESPPEVRIRLTQNHLVRCLKQDTLEFVSKLPILKEDLENRPFRVNRVLQKLRLYFSNDLAKKYLEFYMDILNQPNVNKHTVDIIVFGIIQLADKKWFEDFMTKHVPTDTKIDHVSIDRKILSIQNAICSFAGYARPPVPLPLMLKYVKGDYTQYCIPIFNMYHANLQPTSFKEFVKSIVDTPLSTQKHGLRLAFKCFSTDDLKKVLTEMWTRTKNVSLRLIIYRHLYNTICETDDKEKASSLFETLNKFTSTVHEEDDDELFHLLTSDTLPKNLLNEHLYTVWLQYEKLPDKIKFSLHKCSIVNCLSHNLLIIEPKTFIENIVKEHIHYVFKHSKTEEQINTLINHSMLRPKWKLTINYITLLENKQNLESKLNLTKFITSKCIENWNKVINDSNIFRNFFIEFLRLLKQQSYMWGVSSYRFANILFEYILKELEEHLPEEEIYQILWDLRLSIKTRNIIIEANESKTNENIEDITKKAAIKFSKECVALVVDMFWIMFDSDIQNIISNEALNISVQCCSQKVQCIDIKILVCNELTNVKQFETYMLASRMFPTTYVPGEICFSEYKQTIEKLRTFEDRQIKCYVHQKFIRLQSRSTSLI